MGSPEPHSVTRRNLLLGAAGALVMVGLGGAGRFAFGNTQLLRPPGSQGEDHFQATCIRCNRCVSACPRSALAVSGIEEGLVNVRTPKMAYRRGHYALSDAEGAVEPGQIDYDLGMKRLTHAQGTGFCDFCGLCSKNCPTGALNSFDSLTQWIGLATVFQEFCIAFDKQGGCRKCVDYCPFGAITLDESLRPVVHPEMCNGCGVCENMCPSSSYRTFKGSDRRGINIEVMQEGRPS
ncbi:MAG: 4Fe-4S dicluster domain-containing protein [Coriobacteriales bacterium]|nr:4Fe-4S dicluster domain-containing protein [Coriobacteriales bacterium]